MDIIQHLKLIALNIAAKGQNDSGSKNNVILNKIYIYNFHL